MVQAWYFPPDENNVFYCGNSNGATLLTATRPLEQLEDAVNDPVACDIVILFDFKALLKKNPALRKLAPGSVFDLKLAGCTDDPSRDCSTLESVLKSLLPEKASESVEDRLTAMLDAYELLAGRKLPENFVYKSIELPLSPVLADMELRGIRLDNIGLQQFGGELCGRLDELEKKIYDLAGKKFNINSPRQLAAVLFEDLQLPAPGKKTKSGYSTDAEVLEKLAGTHPLPGVVIEYRQYAKLNSTYVEGLLKYQQSDGKVHTSFNMTATATGRLSSTEPNLQNIPVRSELGGEIRKFLQADDGCVLIDADYSQIELRILACMANDPVMIEAFKNNQDIHNTTACQIFNVEPQAVTADLRRKAKAVNFGIVYGMSAFALSSDLKIPQEEAKSYIKSYFEKYSAVREYLDKSVKDAKARGYAETLFGRKRYLPELKSKIFAVRSFGERVALNMPIQGTAADLIKLAMIKVDAELKKQSLQAGLILQVHDELLLQAPQNEADAAMKILHDTMVHAVDWSVPLDVSLSCGRSYADC
ncbi:MAG: hypothetical protein E7047_06390 [Lentisphaerae bacterium]|nr:hypothetical protein [Lentisphaerota bacterium]